MLRVSLFAALIIALCATVSLATSHPIDGGSVLASGALSISRHQDEGGDDLTPIVLAPSFLVFAVSNVAIGGSARMVTQSGDDDLLFIAIGPKIAYFFGGEDERIYEFISLGLLFSAVDADGETATGTVLSISGGFAFVIGQHLAVLPELWYSHSTTSPGYGESGSSSAFGLGIGLAGFLF